MTTSKITEKQDAACGIITEINQVILFILILNLLNKIRVLQEILVLVKPVMMQTKLVKKKTEIVVPLKHLKNFCRTLNIPLVNGDIGLILTWSKNCALGDMLI